MIVPETAATKLLVSGGRVVGIRTGDRGRGRHGEELGELRAGLGHARPRDDPRRGDAGTPDRRRARRVRAPVAAAGLGARREGGLGGRAAARPRHPHDGLAAPRRQALPRVRRQLHLPDGREPGGARDGGRARLHGRDALRARPPPGVEAPLRSSRPILEGGTRVGVGREDDSRGRPPRAPGPAPLPGRDDRRRRGRARERPGAEGHPLRHALRDARRRDGARRGSAGADRLDARRARRLRRARSARATSGRTWSASATCAPRSARASSAARSVAGVALNTLGNLPPQRPKLEADADVPVFVGERRLAPVSGAGRKALRSTSSRACTCAGTRPGTTRRATSASGARSRARSPRRGCTCAPHRCTRSRATRARPGTSSTVEVTASNCVQCGAISAKGGRLTPARGRLRPRVPVMM